MEAHSELADLFEKMNEPEKASAQNRQATAIQRLLMRSQPAPQD